MDWADKKARKIIKDNRYMSLATADKRGVPWVAVVNYVHDEDYNFYFLSYTSTRHMKHIKRNQKVAFTIYDSREYAPEKTDEVQASGIARLATRSELLKVLELYNKKPHPIKRPRVIEEFVGDSKSKFVKIAVNAAYTLDTRTTDPDARQRIKVKLAKR